MKLRDIFEARIAPLYRNSYPFDVWTHVLDKGKSDPDTLKGYQRHKIGDQVLKGSSFTRSKQLALKNMHFGPVVFEVDQGLITQTNKIIPMDAEFLHYLARRKLSASDPRARKQWEKHNDRAGGRGTHEVDDAMAEEFVVGDLKPFSKYITHIYIAKQQTTYYDASKEPESLHQEELPIKDGKRVDVTKTKDLPNYSEFKAVMTGWAKKHNIPITWDVK